MQTRTRTEEIDGMTQREKKKEGNGRAKVKVNRQLTIKEMVER